MPAGMPALRDQALRAVGDYRQGGAPRSRASGHRRRDALQVVVPRFLKLEQVGFGLERFKLFHSRANFYDPSGVGTQ
jgi:hypothetical protein